MPPLKDLSARHVGFVLVVLSTVLLGCATKTQIQIPAAFHGHVIIRCGGLSTEKAATLRLDSAGHLDNATCPLRQTDAVVTRADSAAPVETSVMWLTTGDGLVREITFDVP